MKTKVVAIVPAAGLGKRFSASEKKTFVKLSGTPLVIYTLKKLHKSASVTEIIPVLRQEDLATGLELAESHNLEKIKQIATGGKERQDSVYNALKLVNEDCLILIHDGARPFISGEMIENLLKEIKGVDGVVPGMPVKETLKEVDIKKRIVLSTVKREKLWTIQTPQIFPFKVIKKAYDKAYADGFHATDDAALVERIGGKIKIIPGSPFNIKITTPEDFDVAECLLTKKELGAME